MIKRVHVHVWELLKRTAKEWNDNNDLFMMSAALSYYAIFSLPGILLMIIFGAGYIFGADAVTGKVFSEIREYIGDDGAMQVQEMITNAYISRNTMLATIIAGAVLIYSSTGVMYNLQQALDRIWEVKPKPTKAFLKFMRDRALSFLMIIVFGTLFMTSMLFSSILQAVTDWISMRLFSINTFTLNTVNLLFNLLTDTVIFTFMFKFVPDVKIKWKHIWIGGFFTAILFGIGKFVISYYISRSDPASTYGAAGTLILILIWVSYSSLIIFFGAIFTKVYAKYMGERVKPEEYAVKTEHIIVEKTK